VEEGLPEERECSLGAEIAHPLSLGDAARLVTGIEEEDGDTARPLAGNDEDDDTARLLEDDSIPARPLAGIDEEDDDSIPTDDTARPMAGIDEEDDTAHSSMRQSNSGDPRPLCLVFLSSVPHLPYCFLQDPQSHTSWSGIQS
jgi:hypothetical protein